MEARLQNNPWVAAEGILLSVDRPGIRKAVEMHIINVGQRAHLIGHYQGVDAMQWLKVPPGARVRFKYRRGPNIWHITDPEKVEETS